MQKAGPQGTLENKRFVEPFSLSLFFAAHTGEVPHRPKKLRGSPAGPAISPRKAHGCLSPTLCRKARSPLRPLCPHSCPLGESSCRLRQGHTVWGPVPSPHRPHTPTGEQKVGVSTTRV